MRLTVWAISIAAYVNVAFLAWTVFGLARCGASESCLGFTWYFLIGCSSALFILLLGGIFWIVGKWRRSDTRPLPIALCTLTVVVSGLLAVAISFRP